MIVSYNLYCAYLNEELLTEGLERDLSIAAFRGATMMLGIPVRPEILEPIVAILSHYKISELFMSGYHNLAILISVVITQIKHISLEITNKIRSIFNKEPKDNTELKEFGRIFLKLTESDKFIKVLKSISNTEEIDIKAVDKLNSSIDSVLTAAEIKFIAKFKKHFKFQQTI